MVLESCMVLLDNSEYMRNGDYVPNRLEAQHDAANMIVGTKTQSNPESTVGVICMTGEMDGSGAELLISPTDDMGKILTALHGVPIRSTAASLGSDDDGSDITAAIQVASLALKHRRNKNGGQRVVVFVGSPLTSDERALQKCGRTLKKNNIAIDVICLGELEENEAKLQLLVDTANGTSDEGANTCHLVTIPAGVLPSDILVTSPIVAGAGAGGAYGAGGGGGGGEAGAGAAAGGGGAGFAEYGGVDPSMDPELAMALRVSMEEERARQERLTAERAAAGGGEGKEGEPAAGGEGGDAAADGADHPDEDALLQQALAMSMQEDSVAPAVASGGGAPPAAAATDMDTTGGGAGDDDDDAAMQMALAMSIQEDSAAPEASAADGGPSENLRQRGGKKDSDKTDDAEDAGNKKDD
jgi:26S proteasome regulatory subunit N10